jgi:formylglycine-generating enzyme required for sulfatase activity
VAAAALATGTGRAAERKGRLYAFLVACQGYSKRDFKPLRHTQSDILAFRRLLVRSGFDQDNIVVMHDRQERLLLPEADKIRRQFTILLKELKPDDTLVVALSGHGVRFKGGKVSYFCPLDADLTRPSTLIGLDWIYQRLKDCPARHKLLLVDACRSEPRSNLAKALPEVSLDKLGLARQPPPKGIAALFSCSDGQDSLEDPELGHSVFFYHVLKGWQGDAADTEGRVTLNSLAGYVTENVPRYVRLTFRDTTQVPMMKVEAEGSWVLPMPRRLNLPRRLTNSVGMELVLIPPGKFRMGSPRDERGHKDDEAEHEIEITRPFNLGVYEVTQAEYQRVMGGNPSWFSKNGRGRGKIKKQKTGRFPVERVSWEEAQEFCRRLSALPKERAAKRVYRLPTEAEWEYACRAGARRPAPFSFGDSLSFRQANFDGSAPYGGAAPGRSLGRTKPVGSYKPNAFGLYDMHGNVAEWCADVYQPDYLQGPKRDPRGPRTGTHRVVRGGSWVEDGVYCRSACRTNLLPGWRAYNIGFRVALSAGADD